MSQVKRVASYEEQSAACWYEMFCEQWETLSDEDPPPLSNICGSDIGESPESIALGYYEESIKPFEPSLFERYTGGRWDF
jgi:hypothetical protein